MIMKEPGYGLEETRTSETNTQLGKKERGRNTSGGARHALEGRSERLGNC